MDDKTLCKLAKEAAKHSYSPYSHCRVGAALLTKAGKVFSGCNVENASYSMTLCAERNAVVSAVAAGERNFSAVAVWASANGEETAFPPCGACLQVLAEFCDPEEFRVLVARGDSCEAYRLRELLPRAFSPEHLK